jgi:hypothetical protein
VSPVADSPPDRNTWPSIVNDTLAESEIESIDTTVNTVPKPANHLNLSIDQEDFDSLMEWCADNPVNSEKHILDPDLPPLTAVSDQGSYKNIGLPFRHSELDEYDCAIVI